jgi:hypothetical protein
MTPEQPVRFERGTPPRPGTWEHPGDRPPPSVPMTAAPVAEALATMDRAIRLRYKARLVAMVAACMTFTLMSLVATVLLHITGQPTASLVAFAGSAIWPLLLVGVALWPPRVS